MRFAFALCLTICLAACDNADDKNVRDAKAVVGSMPKDPDSAQWQEIKGDSPCIRGSVNAKNAFGGYVGFREFFYNTQSKEAGIDPGNSTDAELLAGMHQTHDALTAYSRGFQQCVQTSIDAIHASMKSP